MGAPNAVLEGELRLRPTMDMSDIKSNIGVLQSQFNKLKLPSGITDKFNQEISKFSSTYEKYQQKMAQGIKTKGDATQTSKYLNEIAREYDNIVKVYSKASGMDLKSMFKIDSGPLKDAAAEVERLTKQLENVDIDKTGFKNLGQQLSGVLKNSKLSGEHGLINQMLGDFDKGKVNEAKQALQEIQKEIEKRQYATTTDKNGNVIQKPGTYSEANTTAALNLVNQLLAAADQAGIKIQDIQGPLNQATRNFDELLDKGVNSFKNIGNAAQKEQAAVHGVVEENKNLVNSMASAQQQSQMLTNRIAMYFGLYNVLRKINDVAKRAFQTVKELDKSMTETAVVTNFSVSDMWDQLPRYTATANQLGSTINDVYKATTLYYQQGLNTNQAMGVATETLKMARIGGLEAAEATDMMTAALRGFNMQVNEMSAQRINDVYSKLAAITASNTEELGSAMTRTASIANSAGMQFETTSAFLAQMIETTREAPENLGTAMKTIVARFQEMKKSPTELIDSEGELLDVNRVDKALKSIGVALTNTKGEFRDLDQVFLEIAERWDSLSMGQQRYIATMAAGSRQQSRFIAMMSNYDRTMELVDAANNSAGASQEQFNKTLESMDTKLNKLKNAWDQFAMGLTNSAILKTAIDGFTGGITIINKFIDAVGKISPEPFKDINKSILTLVGTLGALKLGGSIFSKNRGLIEGIFTGMGGILQGKGFGSIKAEIAKKMSGFDMTLAGDNAAQSFYQGVFNTIGNEKSKVQQALGDSLNPNYVNTISLSDYLQLDDVSLQDKGRAIIDALRAGLASNNNLSEEMRIKGEEALKKLEEPFVAGHRSVEHMMKMATGFANHYDFNFDPKAIGVEKLNESITETGNAFTTTGAKLQRFGNMLRNTPLEPFGKLLSVAGKALATIGVTLTLIKAGVIGTTVGLVANTIAWLVNAKAIDADTEALIKNDAARMENGKITEIKNAGQFLKNFAAQGGTVGTVLKGIGSKLTGLLGKIGPFVPKLLAIAFAIASIYSAWKLINQRADLLKDAKTRAADAAEQFSNIKQEVSELKDKIEELNEIDSAFENLVVGTAEFNEKLVESNALVTELISKYPMLNDSKYLSTDKNGRLILNVQGKEDIQKELKQRQGNAQALSLMAAQDVKNFDSNGWIKDYNEAKNELYKINTKYIKEGKDLVKKTTTTLNTTIKSYNPSHARTTKEAEAEMSNKGMQTPEELYNAQKTQVAASYKTAIASLFSGLDVKDFVNRDKMAEIFGESYEDILKNIKADTKEKDRAEAYARAYGYDEYLGKNKFKKGNEEVEIEKEKWNDEVTNKRIKANEQIIQNAELVDSTLSQLDNSISNLFKDISIDTDSLISDILSNSVDTSRDGLAELLKGDNIGKLVEDLTDQQIDALKAAGIKDIEETLRSRAKAIQEVQAQQDVDLAAMMARGSGLNTDTFESKNTTAAIRTIEEIQNRLSTLNESQKHFLAETGKNIEDAFNTQAMDSFMDTYIRGGERTQKRLEQITKNVDWSSSISSLGAVNKMLNSTNEEIQKCGESIKNSTNGSRLLNDAMQEMFASEDWQKITENMDNYVNSAGKLDASGIQKMAQESGTLAQMLNTGALSAGELAAAINYTSIEGVADITSLSDAVIKLIGYFGHLDDAVWSAHNYIENFNEGIDFGEGEDFLKDNIEKIKEYLNPKEGRIQWGNEQLHKYIQSVIGPEEWEKALKNHGYNYKSAIKSVQKRVESYAKGYDVVFNNLAQGKTSTGKKIDLSKIDENLRNIKFSMDENGGLRLSLNGHSIEDLNKYIQQAEGIGEDQANMMIEFWRGISPNFDKDVKKQSFNAGLRDSSFIKDKSISYTGTNGEKQTAVIISKNELRALAGVNEKSQHDTKGQIQRYAGKDENGNAKVKTFQNMNGKEFRTDYLKMMTEWNELLYGKGTKKQFINRKGFLNEEGNAVALDKLISQYAASGIQDQQALGMAYEAAKKNDEKQYEYNGQIIDMTKIDSFQAFLEEITKIDENVHWVEIGESIAQGFFNYQKEKEKAEEAVKTGEIPENNAISGGIIMNALFGQGTNGSMQGKPPEGTTIPGVGFVPKEKDFTKDIETKFANFFDKFSGKDLLDGLTNGIFKIFNNNNNNNNNGNNKATKKEDTDTNGSQEAEESSKTLAEIINKLSDAIGKAEEKINSFSNIFKIFSGKSNNSNKKTSDSSKSSPTIVPKIKGLTEKVTDFFKNDSFTKTIKVEGTDKVKEAGDKIKDIKKDTKTPSTLQVSAEVKKSKKQKKETITYVAKDKVVGEPGDIEKEIQYKAASKIKNEPDDLNKTIHYSADLPTVSDQWATLHLNLSENSKKFKVTPAAKGMNQYYSTDSLPNLGSLASGTKKGRVGPKGNGGLTLTGEEGYEVAWLPSEHRSMILGVNGPEMLNLPKNAVVWNHEQSKNIIKKNSIPSGSAAIGAGSCDSTADPYPDPGQTKVTTKGKTSKSQNKSNSGKNGKKTEKILSQTWKLLKVAGKITNWWENISRKVEGAQRISDRNQKAFEKILNKAGSTLDDVKGVSVNYQKSLKQIITLNQEIVTRYEKQLNNLTNGTGQNAESRNNAVSKINKTANNVTKAEAKLELARQTASKKDDKRAKKNLKKAKQRLKNAKKKNDKSAAIDTVTYEDTIYTKTRKKVNGKKKTVKKKKKVKSTRAVDWSKIIKYDEATDTWVLDEDAINKAAGGNKKAAKAIKEKGNKLIDEKIQRRNAAQDKIDAARESLNKLADDTYNMFNRWEKSLTETYLISKKLETLQKTADIFKTQEEYISTKTTAGYRAPNALDQLTQVLASKQANLTQQVLANADLLTASFDAFEKSLNFDEYIDNYLVGKLKEGEIEGEGETARSQYEAASIAFGILREAGLDKLDTYDPEKARQAYEEYAAKNFTNGTDDEVVKVLDKIAEYQGNYLDAINETYGSVTEIYSALNEYEEYINDFEESLLKGLEEEINKEIEKQEKLNSALTNAFKNLLDEVKRRLDQRRQTEDNAKTESDIAKKQQRLATLRADTSGGHASEIAQLEQELAEAQQNYGRTLEDQLLERLQEQGDKAAEQRERQIALLEAERDLAQALGTNLEQVKEYLANGDYEKIRALWLENQGYDEALPNEREALERQFEAEWDKYKAYGEAASNLRDVLSKVNNPEEYQTSVTTALGSIQGLLNDIITKGIKQPEVKNSVTSAAEAKEKGLDASAALSALKATNENATYKDLASAYSAKEFKESGIDIKDALTAFTHEQLKEGGYTAEDFKNANVDYGIAKGLFSSEQLVAAKYEEAIKEAKQNNYNQFLYNHGSTDKNNKSKYKGKLSAESYKTQLERGKYLGYTEHKVAHDLATQKALNWKIVLQAIKAAGTAGPKTVKSWNPKAKTSSDFYKGYIAVFGKKKWDKYAKGGMNYTTGPAWLDGTRAKPEAVLNATETKNFIALKDILSDVMGHISDSESTTYGDSTWEININVDHLNNDYDVDKVAKRVEKIITDNASYRNVTMVRKFR